MKQSKFPATTTLARFLKTLGRPLYLLSVVIILGSIALILLVHSLITTISEKTSLALPTPKPKKKLSKKISKVQIPLPPINFPSFSFTGLFSHLKLTLPTPHLPHLNKMSTRLIPPLHFPKYIIRLLIFLFFLSSLGVYSYLFVLKDLPNPKSLITHNPSVTTKMYDRHGELLYKIYKNENRSIISLSDIPSSVVKSTLVIEDATFYDHPGFSLKGIARAFSKNTTTGSMQGGSTITQQLVKNTLLTNEKTVQRKVREVVLAVLVENYFTKDEILSMYLNQVGYGGTAYGVEEAAQQYFGKSIKDVNLAEAALIAGLPAAPSAYSPFGAYPEAAISRQHEVLRRLVEEGYISSEQAEIVKTTPLHFASPRTDIKAPHFVMYAKDLLADRYGEALVNSGGLEVTTTLDLDIQELAQVAITDELSRLKHLNVSNAAVLVTNPKTGEILAMVGSQNYFDVLHDGQVNVTLRPRQPGSSIKVITYTLALENGLTAITPIDDTPVTYRLPGTPPYSPRNYDGRYHGRVTLRQALGNSYNIPAVKTLSQLGVNNLIQKASNMGIDTWKDTSRFGLALTLGSGEVKMVDMAVAFGTLSNYGHKVPLNPFISVTDYTHTTIDTLGCTQSPGIVKANQNGCPGELVVSPGAAFIISDILADNQARSQAFGSNSVLNIQGHQVAVKTGTTNSLRDNWTIGYTDKYLVAVWVGNNDNTPMSRVASGITGASPIWSRIMTALLADEPAHRFIKPDTVTEVSVCPLTSTLNCAGCPNARTEYFIQGTEPKNACSPEFIERLLITPSPDQARDQILQGAQTTAVYPTSKPVSSFEQVRQMFEDITQERAQAAPPGQVKPKPRDN